MYNKTLNIKKITCHKYYVDMYNNTVECFPILTQEYFVQLIDKLKTLSIFLTDDHTEYQPLGALEQDEQQNDTKYKR